MSAAPFNSPRHAIEYLKREGWITRGANGHVMIEAVVRPPHVNEAVRYLANELSWQQVHNAQAALSVYRLNGPHLYDA